MKRPRSLARSTGPLVLAAVLVAAAAPSAGQTTVYTKDNAPAAPTLQDLPRKDSVTQHGITWTFEKAAPVGQFVNGDWYVVGPVKVVAVAPEPKDGRHGSMLNIAIDPTKSESKVGFDDRIPHGRYEAKLFQAPPISMKPGDALVSSISFQSVEPIQPMLPRSRSHRTTEHSPVRAAAVLTCLKDPVPPDAFRPAYCDRSQKPRLARDLRRDLLPRLKPVEPMPKLAEYERVFERPWLDVCMDEFGAPADNMPVYGNEFTRATGNASLILALDLPAERKETLLVRFVQVGIDLWGLMEAGKPGWSALGGHGNGRKWALIFTGLMFGDERMQRPNRTFPQAVFSEDLQTMFDDCWTGAKVVYAGHVGPKGLPNKKGWGRYEHLPPNKWEDKIGESYRRCCTSMCWIGEALAIQLYGAERLWDHDAFLVYADRWMVEDDTEFIKAVSQAGMGNYDNDWSRQGMVWDPFVKAMWNAYRPKMAAPVDRWKYPHGKKETPIPSPTQENTR